jgi:hypothetical protein
MYLSGHSGLSRYSIDQRAVAGQISRYFASVLSVPIQSDSDVAAREESICPYLSIQRAVYPEPLTGALATQDRYSNHSLAASKLRSIN